MNNIDDNYRFFAKTYRSGYFAKASRLVIEILAMMPDRKDSIPVSWEYKLSALFQFLHETHFEFKNEEDFYEMLSTISIKMQSDPNIDWKAILT